MDDYRQQQIDVLKEAVIEAGAVDEAEANSGVKELSEAVKADDDVDVSKALVRLSTFVKQLHDAGSRLINE